MSEKEYQRYMSWMFVEGDQLLLSPYEGCPELSCDEPTCSRKEYVAYDSIAYYNNEEDHFLCEECYSKQKFVNKLGAGDYKKVLTSK